MTRYQISDFDNEGNEILQEVCYEREWVLPVEEFRLQWSFYTDKGVMLEKWWWWSIFPVKSRVLLFFEDQTAIGKFCTLLLLYPSKLLAFYLMGWSYQQNTWVETPLHLSHTQQDKQLGINES